MTAEQGPTDRRTDLERRLADLQELERQGQDTSVAQEQTWQELQQAIENGVDSSREKKVDLRSEYGRLFQKNRHP